MAAAPSVRLRETGARALEKHFPGPGRRIMKTVNESNRLWLWCAGFWSAVVLAAACGGSDKTGFAGTEAATTGSGAASGGGCSVSGQVCPVKCDASLGCVDCLQNPDCGVAKPAC